MFTKTCSRCKQSKDLSEFTPRNGNRKGHLAWCKSCYCNYSRERRLAALGINEDAFSSMLEKQNGLCGVCGVSDGTKLSGDKHRLCVDHDHVSGRVRGLLCHSCNRGLGLLGDTVECLERAAQYLRDHQEAVKGD